MKNSNSDIQKIRLTWAYNRLQATGRSQNRLIWAGVILCFGTFLILFAPDDAKEIKFFDFSFQSIEKVLPAVIFLILMVLQGNLIAAREAKDRIINRLKKHRETVLSGVYEIDENPNFIDYLAFVSLKKGLYCLEPLLYPLFILFIAFPAIWLLVRQIKTVLTQGVVSGGGFLVLINLLLGFLCCIVSVPFFRQRWERSRKAKAKKREANRMNVKRIVIAGLIIWIVDSIFFILTCGWLFKWVYELPPNIWRDFAAMPATAMNIIGPHAIGIIRGLLFALVFAILYKGIPGKGVVKGIIFGVLVWLVGALTGMAAMPFFMTIATGVVIYWILQQLVLGVINGAIVGAIYKEKKKKTKKKRR